MMVYGEGEHVDACGRSLGRYPTRPPQADLEAFHDGCFICQPTVFLRREAFEAVGPLDESLATAFDFELWLRIFRHFPDRIAHLDRLMASSRLHGSCITQSQRRQVAVEGVRVLARHAGRPQPHWLLTYLEEACASYPFASESGDLWQHMTETVTEVADCLDAPTLSLVESRLKQDARLKLALPGVFADIHADGWAGPRMALRLRGLPRSASALRLHCLCDRPSFKPLTLTITGSWGIVKRLGVRKPGSFALAIPLPDALQGDRAMAWITADDFFVPSLLQAGSSDDRQLSFKVQALSLDS
jgi:hypothetical protein